MIRKSTTPSTFVEAASDRVDEPSELDQLIEEERVDPEFRAAYEDAFDREVLLKALVAQRKTLELSQGEVARRMGTTQSAVSDLERGAADPRWTTLQRYARAVGVRLQTIVKDDTELAAWYRLRDRARLQMVVERRSLHNSPASDYLEDFAAQVARTARTGRIRETTAGEWTLTFVKTRTSTHGTVGTAPV